LEERSDLRVLAGGCLFAHQSRGNFFPRWLVAGKLPPIRRELTGVFEMLSKKVMEATITRLLFSRIIPPDCYWEFIWNMH
jgi:hypothetical protein